MPYTYILEWTKFNKRYIGARWSNKCKPDDLWSSYFTSSKYVKEFVKDNGDPDIILIDKTFENPNDAIIREKELLNKYRADKNPEFLNKAIGGVFDFNDPEIRKKNGEAHRGKKHTPKWIAWVTNFHRNRVRKPETYEKISKALTGKKLSPEHRAKCKNGRTGKESPFKGKIHTLETKEKIRKSKCGFNASIETKNKMSLTRTGKIQSIVICPHCGKSGGNATMPRWHFNNCKHKQCEE